MREFSEYPHINKPLEHTHSKNTIRTVNREAEGKPDLIIRSRTLEDFYYDLLGERVPQDAANELPKRIAKAEQDTKTLQERFGFNPVAHNYVIGTNQEGERTLDCVMEKVDGVTLKDITPESLTPAEIQALSDLQLNFIEYLQACLDEDLSFNWDLSPSDQFLMVRDLNPKIIWVDIDPTFIHKAQGENYYRFFITQLRLAVKFFNKLGIPKSQDLVTKQAKLISDLRVEVENFLAQDDPDKSFQKFRLEELDTIRLHP